MPDPAVTLTDDASTIGVVDDAGHVSLIPASQALHLGDGFHLASPAQLSILHSQQEQAGLLGALKAAGQSAADTATLGGASWLETATGLRTPEAIEAGAAAHPVSSFLGSAVGVAAPLGAEKLVVGRLGEGLLSKVAGGAPGLISDIGEAAQGAVRAAAPGKLGRITTEALAHGAGSAVEGAAYGFGQSVAEDALDPNLTVESAMARGGTSALLGAGLGAAIGVPLGLVSSVIGRVSSAELADRFEEFAAERDLKGTGGNVGKLVERKGRQEAMQISKEARDLGIFGRYNSAEDINAKASAVLDDTGQKMRAVVQQADDAALGKPKAMADAQGVLDRVRAGPLKELQDSAFQEGAASQLETIVDRLQSDMDATFERTRLDARRAGVKDAESNQFRGRSSIDSLWNLRKDIDLKLYGLKGTQDPAGTVLKDSLRDFRGIVSDEINASIDRAGMDSAAWKKLSRNYAVASEMEKLSAQGIKKAVGAAPISFGESVATLAGFVHGGPAGVVLPLAYAGARRYGGDVLGMAARGAAGALKGTGGAIPAVADAAASVATAGAVDVAEGIRAQRDRVAALAALERTARDVVQDSREAMTDLVTKGKNQRAPAAPSSADILKVVKSVNELGNRPQNAADLVASMTSETHEHAPSMTMKTGEIAGRALAYLAKNAPQIAKPFPFGPEIVPDRSVLLAFNEKVEALKDPIGTLARGPSKLAVEAITAVYPTLMQHAREALISALAHAGPDKVYSPAQRAQFSAVLGMDLDGTNSPQLSAVSQAAFLASSTPTPHHGAGGRRSLKTKTLSERYSPRGGGSLRNP